MQNSKCKTKIMLYMLIECKTGTGKELMTTNANHVFVQLV